MSFVEQPEINPYAAPEAQLIPVQEPGTQLFVGYAGFWLRVAASIIDGILLQVVGFVSGLVVGVFFGLISASSSNPEQVQQMAVPVSMGVGFLINLLYFTLMESSSTQGTLGKMALSIKVTDLNGRRISFGKAVGRHLGKIVSSLILGIGYLMVAFTEKRQGLHDMMAGTLVIKAPKG